MYTINPVLNLPFERGENPFLKGLFLFIWIFANYKTSAVIELLEMKGSGASKLLSNLVQTDIIEPVSGHGKGKYKFKK